ncbi:MAG: hypothetical protein RL318_2822, partial [Fibrobacterota bacterium]
RTAASRPVPAAAANVSGTPEFPEFVKPQVQRLVDGNKRFLDGRSLNIERDAGRRLEVAKGQHPFAIILTCSDSRVPPEILFDQGLGELFVVRTAGNVADDIALGSMEYAAEHLNVKLIVVLGHERCGAVQATVDGGELPGHISSIGAKIKPAVAIGKAFPGDKVDNCVRANVVNVMSGLRESKPILAHLIEKGELAVVGARYDLDDGTMTWIP